VWDPTPTSARESGLEFGKSWTTAGFPKFFAITWQHPHALLRRLLRRQLGEQWSVSRRAAHRARCQPSRSVSI
jgi:hypothetical protein